MLHVEGGGGTGGGGVGQLGNTLVNVLMTLTELSNILSYT